MAPKLKPMKDEKELAAVPTDQPVLVELEPPVSSAETERSEVVTSRVTAAERKEELGTEDGTELLKQQLKASQDARALSDKAAEDARALTAQRESELREARAQNTDSESDAVASGLAAAQAEQAQAKSAFKTAFEAGDGDGMAEAQAKIGRSAADIREYERAGATLADRKERETKAANDPPERPRPADVNQVIDQMQLLPAERDWLKAHPEALMDRTRNVELDAAYIKATRKGLTRGTPKYFEFIEREMGYVEDEPAREESNTETERTASMAAPVSRENRSAATGQANTDTRITLTPAQRELARSMGISDTQYARGVQQLEQAKRENPEKYATRG